MHVFHRDTKSHQSNGAEQKKKQLDNWALNAVTLTLHGGAHLTELEPTDH